MHAFDHGMENDWINYCVNSEIPIHKVVESAIQLLSDCNTEIYHDARLLLSITAKCG